MSVITTLTATKTLFPSVVTNEFINSMPRRELTPQERELPYAHYYFKDMARIPEEDLKRVNQGPIDPADALDIRDCAGLLDDGYLPAETG